VKPQTASQRFTPGYVGLLVLFAAAAVGFALLLFCAKTPRVTPRAPPDSRSRPVRDEPRVLFSWNYVWREELGLTCMNVILLAEPPGESSPRGLPSASARPIVGACVRLDIGNRERDVLPSGSQPIPPVFDDGSFSVYAKTDAEGKIDIATKARRFAITVEAEIDDGAGGRRTVTSVFERDGR
jgi:hypothetical protein